jgi:hypothetical protein
MERRGESEGPVGRGVLCTVLEQLLAAASLVVLCSLVSTRAVHTGSAVVTAACSSTLGLFSGVSGLWLHLRARRGTIVLHCPDCCAYTAFHRPAMKLLTLSVTAPAVAWRVSCAAAHIRVPWELLWLY